MNNAPTYGFTAPPPSSISQYPSHPSLHFRPSFQPSPPEAYALPRPSFSSHANNINPSTTNTANSHSSDQHHHHRASPSSTGVAPRKSTSELWGMPAAQANYVVSQRMLGGGGFAYGQEEQPMVESSPYGDDYDSDEMDEDFGDEEDSYEEENSFDGPLKEEYRGRAWSHGQEQQQAQIQQQQQQQNNVVQRQQQVIEQQQYMAHQLQQQASADAYAAQARWNAQQEALAAANALAHQQQAQFEAQQAAAGPRDLDRLFHNMRPVEQPIYAAPAPAPVAPKPTPSSLPLAPFAAEAIWSLLQNPFSPAAPEKPTSVVRDDSVTYDRLPAGEFGGRDEWTGAVAAPMVNGRWEGVGKKNAGGFKSWEEEKWSK
jgi:hypothetical protein